MTVVLVSRTNLVEALFVLVLLLFLLLPYFPDRETIFNYRTFGVLNAIVCF